MKCETCTVAGHCPGELAPVLCGDAYAGYRGRREYPPLAEMAANALTSLARHLEVGSPVVPPEISAARMATCRACEHFDAGQERCFKCGCPLAHKTAWALEHCPLPPPERKWGTGIDVPDQAATPFVSSGEVRRPD